MKQRKKMFCSLRCALVIILCLKHELMLALTVRKFVYQKDISEHCRRRVMPSVFLGRHVVDATSQILHFTRLALPYSCFISVRSESGTNLILVIEMLLEDDITSSCSKNGNQLLVYEMSETFGGYWGPLSDSIIKPDRVNDTKYYTLKTTQPTEPSNVDSEEYDDAVEITAENVNTNITNLITKSDDSEEYIRMELPIVNVSGKLILGEAPRKKVYDIDNSFDVLYDVTPRPGFFYDTSIIPLVQFAITKTIGVQRKSNQDESKYEIGYNLKPITLDERLLLSTKSVTTKKYKTHKYNVNSRLNFKTSKSPLAAYRRHTYIKKPIIITQQHILTNPLNIHETIHETPTESIFPINENTHGNISWDFIDGLIKSYGTTASTTATITIDGTSQEVYKNISNLFQKILDTRYNSSVYLAPNLSVYYKDVPLYASVTRTSTTNENAFQFIKGTGTNLYMTPTLPLTRKTENSVLSEVSKVFDNVNNSSMTNINEDRDITNLKINATVVPTLIVGNSTSSSSISKRFENLTGSLVNRESWENVVQVAPDMAVILHQLIGNQSRSTHDLNVTSATKRSKRKKRYIESVPIENARPHNVTIRGDAVTTAAAKYDVADMQDFGQLVEIQDDELHGRVALRYLRRYVGPTLFNICDTTDVATRYVYLFNSSRIVLVISNFTMNSMTVIITTAQTVMTGHGRCPADHLECQVSGARVCIDSQTACDGIPNCGSYDIYDEDRLMCGAAIGVQHNVYLAAFTFLAVLLTVLYGVHYWLRRCVPKVSDAFFIYTDGTENVLYLDTIMRSPTDDDDASKMAYQGNILDDDLLLFSEVNEGKRSNKFKRFLICLFTCSLFRKKTRKQEAYDEMAQEGLYASLEEQKKRYSYAELELRKILETERIKKDIAVQTGDSLNMSNMTNLGVYKSKNQPELPANTSQSLLALNEYTSFQEINNPSSPDELSILNFFNNSKSDSSKSQSSDETVKIQALAKRSITLEEKEIKSHTYDHKAKKENVATTSTLAGSNIFTEGSTDRTKKHLRFEERTSTIPSGDHDDDSDDYVNELLNRRRSVVLGIGKTWRKRDLDSIDEGEESVGNIQGTSIRFWGKSKKSKK